MSDEIDFKNKIKTNSSLFTNFVKQAVNASPKVQNNFLDVTEKVAITIHKILEDANLIVNLKYKGNEFWIENRCKTACFVDGGVDKTSIISSAPLSIRTGSYIVKPDAKDKNREFFEESMVFLGDLYDPKNDLYDFSDDDFDEDQMLNKKKDGARIIFEAATIIKHILLNRKFDYCFLHGPIEATVMPFTVLGFPAFTKFAVENMLPFYSKNKLNLEARHIVNVYLEALNCIKESKFPIYGIVETSNSAPYIKNLLYSYKSKGSISEKDFNNTLSTIKKYKITDTHLFEIILQNGQALRPLEIKKQINGFSVTSGSAWESKMDSFPSVQMGYIKVNNHSAPIRIESLILSENLIKDYEYILATARLLPNYGFPVGLNVVDKFAKIPNWMSKASRKYYATHLLKQAINSKDQNTISLAVKILSKKVRSWKNRPLGGLSR
ncbi:DNA double-strand break repair nuclease NurA [Candidatus Pelagibacter sp.]|uniref:DNA double-strand break repair nuclease NurA n=1 Tax=Candidatus Pelagibacter sp. TaxID=2024849 RepID=UPI003F84F70A